MKSASSSPLALEEITLDRYLSVILENKLSLNEHIKHGTQKIYKLCRKNLKTCNLKPKKRH